MKSLADRSAGKRAARRRGAGAEAVAATGARAARRRGGAADRQRFRFTSDADGERAAVQLGAVHGGDGGVGFLPRAIGDKGKALGGRGGAVGGDEAVGDGAEGREGRLELGVGDGGREIGNVETRVHGGTDQAARVSKTVRPRSSGLESSSEASSVEDPTVTVARCFQRYHYCFAAISQPHPWPRESQAKRVVDVQLDHRPHCADDYGSARPLFSCRFVLFVANGRAPFPRFPPVRLKGTKAGLPPDR